MTYNVSSGTLNRTIRHTVRRCEVNPCWLGFNH